MAPKKPLGTTTGKRKLLEKQPESQGKAKRVEAVSGARESSGGSSGGNRGNPVAKCQTLMRSKDMKSMDARVIIAGELLTHLASEAVRDFENSSLKHSREHKYCTVCSGSEVFSLVAKAYTEALSDKGAAVSNSEFRTSK